MADKIGHQQAQHAIRRRAMERIFALSLKAQHRANAQRTQRRPLARAKLAADKQQIVDPADIQAKAAPPLCAQIVPDIRRIEQRRGRMQACVSCCS